MQSSPFSCHFLLPRSKYSPQHPVLKYPHPLMWHIKFHNYTKQQLFLLNGRNDHPNFICSQFLHECDFELVPSFPNIWTLSHFWRSLLAIIKS
jgi:hypothetical protein